MRNSIAGAFPSLLLAPFLTLGLALSLALGTGNAVKAAEAVTLPNLDWSFEGMVGSFDRGSVQRGLQVYLEVCAGCHSLDLVAYRNLRDLGFSEIEVKAIAAEYEVTDGPNDEGEMYQRPARPSDRFVAPYPNEQAGRAANNGAWPPDLSLMTKARLGGADYLHAVLVGYEDAPEGVEVMDGMYYNAYFPGHQIAMPPPLYEDGVEYADGTTASIDQMATDVTTFLAWAAEPELERRKSMGISVVVFLVVFTALLYAVKRRVWSDVH